ncbi:hypothetical protein V1477_003810, partial [Vespula maculifrons]
RGLPKYDSFLTEVNRQYHEPTFNSAISLITIPNNASVANIGRYGGASKRASKQIVGKRTRSIYGRGEGEKFGEGERARTLTGRVKGNENSVGSILKSSLEDEEEGFGKGSPSTVDGKDEEAEEK